MKRYSLYLVQHAEAIIISNDTINYVGLWNQIEKPIKMRTWNGAVECVGHIVIKLILHKK